MKKPLFFILITILFTHTFTYANEGVLGIRYAHISVGRIYPGDSKIDSIDNSLADFDILSNLPVTKNVDVIVKYSHEKIDGLYGHEEIDTYTRNYGIGLNYTFLLDKKWDPYVGVGIHVRENKGRFVSSTVFSEEKETDTGLYIESGVQYNLPHNISSLSKIIFFKAGNYDDTGVDEFLHIWFSDKFGLGIGASYFIDSEDLSIRIGITLDI